MEYRAIRFLKKPKNEKTLYKTMFQTSGVGYDAG
jgi:hypothetical protein